MQKVDTQKKNRKRHTGIESKIPVFIDGKQYEGNIFSTKCGLYLRNYSDASKFGTVSYFYTDGELFSKPCKECLPEDYERIIEQKQLGSLAKTN